ncbi:hypothetical protein, partial [Mesorhizobium sp. M7A.F.Ca.CA.002.15.2.1]
VDVIATRHASPTGLVADVPAPTIIEAAQRMLATRRRDHPHLPDLAGLSAQQPWGNDMREDVKRAV